MFTHQFFSLIHQMAIYFPVFLLVFVWHGFFKALAAKLMGDNTAQQEGFLTFNPLVHVDIFGLALILFIFFIFGWLFSAAMPPGMLIFLLLALGVRWTIQTPVDDRNFTSYTAGGVVVALVSLLSNILLACFALVCAKFFVVEGLPRYAFVTLVEFIKGVVDVTIWFFVLNLLPFPPFDCGQAIRYLLPESQKYVMDWLEEYSFYIIFILFFLPYVSDFFWDIIYLVDVSIKKFLFGLLF